MTDYSSSNSVHCCSVSQDVEQGRLNRGMAAVDPKAMHRNFLWCGILMIACTLTFLAIVINFLSSSQKNNNDEDAAEGQLTASAADGQLAHVSVPFGLGNDQMQLIRQDGNNSSLNPVGNVNMEPSGGQLVHHNKSFPAGLGNDQMQLIRQDGNNSSLNPVGNVNMEPSGGQLVHHNKSFPAGLGNDQMQLIRQDGPYLGLSLSEVPANLAEVVGLSGNSGINSGAYVSAVINGSPGQKAGVQPGDLLLRVDGIELTNAIDIGRILAGKKAGDVIKVQLIRRGIRKSIYLTLENVPLGLDVGQTSRTPWLGADVQDIDAVMRIQFNLPDNRGILVSHVVPNSPAAIAGLTIGDVIRTAIGQRIRNVVQFQTLIQKAKPDQQIRLGVQRAGISIQLDVVLSVQPVAAQTIPFLAPAEVIIECAWLGMDVRELSRNDLEALGLSAETQGILVNDVEGPPATIVGFQSGDIITALNNVATLDIKSFVAATQRQTSAVAEVIRGDKRFFISIPPPGYTQQGTRLHTGLDNKFRQLAVVQPSLIAILAGEKELNTWVANEHNAGVVILVDLGKQAYTMVEINNAIFLPDLLGQWMVAGLICGSIETKTSENLASRGIAVYSGVVSTVFEAITLYRQHNLVAAGGR